MEQSNCLEHNWSDWSSKMPLNVYESELVEREAGSEYSRYSFRHCWNCGREMPNSRVYFKNKKKEKNAVEFKELKLDSV